MTPRKKVWAACADDGPELAASKVQRKRDAGLFAAGIHHAAGHLEDMISRTTPIEGKKKYRVFMYTPAQKMVLREAFRELTEIAQQTVTETDAGGHEAKGARA